MLWKKPNSTAQSNIHPCKIGDVYYRVEYRNGFLTINAVMVESITYTGEASPKIWAGWIGDHGGRGSYLDIGVNAFKTPEEIINSAYFEEVKKIARGHQNERDRKSD